MTNVCRIAGHATVAFCSAWLTACAVAPQDPPAAGAAAATAAAARADKSIAGTRLPVTTTDRMVKQIGNAGAREMARDKPPNPGTGAN